jgi:S-DNA-T family DNA segregation ATPase FtsK/SpoIIIE
MAEKKTQTTKQAAGRKATDTPAVPLYKRIGWMVLAAAWLFTVACLIDYDPADWPSHAVAPHNAEVTNCCGRAGAMLAYQLQFNLGPGVWVMLTAVGVYLGATAIGKHIDQLPLRAVGVVVLATAASGFVALEAPAASSMPEGSGGLLAIYIVSHLTVHFGHLGTFLALLGMLGVGATVAADELVAAAPHGLVAVGRKLAAVRWPRPVLVGASLNPLQWFARNRSRSVADRTLKPRAVPVRHGASIEQLDRADDLDDAPVDAVDEAEYEEDELLAAAGEAADEYEAEYEDEEEAGGGDAGGRTPMDPQTLRDRIKKLPITIAAAKKPTAPPQAPPQDLSGYQFPSIDCLVDPESSFTEEMAKIVREQAEVLERSLQTYRIDAEVVAIDAGPVITLYEVQLAPGTKVSQINAIASDIARELKAQNIRIVPNTAGKSTVGIEVPNLKKERVRLKELMALGGNDIHDKMRLPMFLGKDASGAPLIGDLAQMPHMLIAGTTGSGKSVCINSIVMSWLLTRRPDELKLILVDPKMVEMAQFRDIPHLMCPVVTEMNKAAAILEWAVQKMDERYSLLAEAGVRDLDNYNQLSWEDLCDRFEPTNEEEEAKIPKKLPRIVFIIDELADLICTNKEVEGFIVRIAQKARAVGIHLILATQRPQANVVTGLIKSNMPCRVSFKVASGMDSRIVLDSKGAELLLGQGDMLYLSPRTSKLTRAQGTLVDDSEVRQAVKFLKEISTQSFEPQLVQLRAPGGDEGDDEESGEERDPLFEQAVRIVLETKRGSVSLLQRRLAIGYSRSSRLIEQMAQAGIIGDYKGSQAREVTMTVEEWDELCAQAHELAAADADEAEALGDASWDDESQVPEEYDDEYRR